MIVRVLIDALDDWWGPVRLVFLRTGFCLCARSLAGSLPVTAGVFGYFAAANIDAIMHTARRGIDIASHGWALVPFVELLVSGFDVLICSCGRCHNECSSTEVRCPRRLGYSVILRSTISAP